MSSNDAIVLKANFDDWKARVEGTNVDPWLYYCVEQFVKPYMLDDDEILSGIVDGGNDGGFDAIYLVANQRQIVDETTELDTKNVSRLRLIFMQVKESGGFKPTEIEKGIEFTDDFFDLSKPADGFGTRYNENVVRIMRTWKETFLKVSGSFPETNIDYYYITGDDTSPDQYAIDSSNRVLAKTKSHINAECEYHCVGAERLWEQVQKRPPKSRKLNWSETPMAAKDGTVGLVNLKNYYEFLKDENGDLAESIFESNVRGYQRNVGVNTQIRGSLNEESQKPNFWLLNNGITIITPKATPAGHLGVDVQDPQIVNGLQTSREIFDYFSGGSDVDDDRSVLVRVIETSDADVRDKVIRATNSQNLMLPAQLRMTDQIHRDIEEVFKKFGLYYDRRKGFYRDQGKPVSKIISVNAVTQAVLTVLLQRPNDARARPGDYFKKNDQYNLLFGEGKYPLPMYLKCVQIVAATERFLEDEGISRGDIKNIKFYVASGATRSLCQMVHPPAGKIALSIPDPNNIDVSVFKDSYRRVSRVYNSLSAKSDGDTVARGTELLRRLTNRYKSDFGKTKAKKK
ncbi:AIPR family protein [Pyruvatibacter mobilis]|uniref:AIPR family protein n=1 Tax=Pyruvatibacter mobilis TaxID=1712261 RepID=UPI003BAC8A4C